MTVTKKAKKAAKKRVAKKRAIVSKTVKKQIASTGRKATKANVKNVAQDKEIARLKEEVAKLVEKGKKSKKKVNSKRISEYNLFIRKQINSGFTFVRAVKEWNKYQALMAKDKRRPSAYNQFIGSQMRLGKTFQQAVALWRLAKAGKLGKKGSTRTITKTKYRTRTIKSKPKIKYRTRTLTKTVVKRTKSKPKVVEKIKYRTRKVPTLKKTTKVVEKVDYEKLMHLFSSAMPQVKTVTKKDISEVINADDEEIAFKIVQTYFKEIARFGFKKQLTLDEIINAYLYALARVTKEERDERALEESIKNSGMKK